VRKLATCNVCYHLMHFTSERKTLCSWCSSVSVTTTRYIVTCDDCVRDKRKNEKSWRCAQIVPRMKKIVGILKINVRFAIKMLVMANGCVMLVTTVCPCMDDATAWTAIRFSCWNTKVATEKQRRTNVRNVKDEKACKKQKWSAKAKPLSRLLRSGSASRPPVCW
jgi:hypothetical protein